MVPMGLEQRTFSRYITNSESECNEFQSKDLSKLQCECVTIVAATSTVTTRFGNRF